MFRLRFVLTIPSYIDKNISPKRSRKFGEKRKRPLNTDVNEKQKQNVDDIGSIMTKGIDDFENVGSLPNAGNEIRLTTSKDLLEANSQLVTTIPVQSLKRSYTRHIYKKNLSLYPSYYSEESCTLSSSDLFNWRLKFTIGSKVFAYQSSFSVEEYIATIRRYIQYNQDGLVEIMDLDSVLHDDSVEGNELYVEVKWDNNDIDVIPFQPKYVRLVVDDTDERSSVFSKRSKRSSRS